MGTRLPSVLLPSVLLPTVRFLLRVPPHSLDPSPCQNPCLHNLGLPRCQAPPLHCLLVHLRGQSKDLVLMSIGNCLGTDPQNLGPIADYEVKTLASVKTVKMWKKECIRLKDSEQEIKPSSEEKIKLAKIGLGLHELVFEANGNAEHVHNTILDSSLCWSTAVGIHSCDWRSTLTISLRLTVQKGNHGALFTRCTESSQTIHPTTPAHYR